MAYHMAIRMYHTDHGEIFPNQIFYEFDTLEKMVEFKKKLDREYTD